MPIFRYTARDSSGTLVRGAMVSRDIGELYDMLKTRNFYLVKASQESRILKAFATTGIKRTDLIHLFFQLSTMAKAGVPLTNTLEALSYEVENRNLKRILREILLSVEAGYSLSTAMEAYPIFPPWLISLVRTGEASGNLDKVFMDISKFLEWQQKIIDEVKHAITYPAIILSAFVLLIIFVSIFLIPMLTSIMGKIVTSTGAALPLPAQLLFSLNETLRNIWPLFILVPAGIFIFWKSGMKVPKLREFLDTFKYNMPIVGRIFRFADLSRFSRHFAALYEAGIDITRILELLEKVVSSVNFSMSIRRMRELTESGRTLSQAATEAGGFPLMLSQMFATGEKTGEITSSMNQVGDYCDRQLSLLVKRATSLLEPLMMVMLSGMVGFLIITLVTAIYSLMGQIR